MRCLLLTIAVLTMGGGLARTVQAHDFRMDTELFEADQKEPFLVTLTVFSNGIVYDFRHTEPKEVTVFDPLNGRFTLLDESRQVKAVVKTQELLDFCLELDKRAAQQRDRLLAFCAQPTFESTATPLEENGQSLTEVRMTAKAMSYAARGQKPPHPETVKAYRQYADWCARLNAAIPGNLPAGARLALNQSLAEQEVLPLEVTRTIPLTTKTVVMRSEHRLNWKLSGDDLKRIDRAGDMMAKFETVSFNDYRAGTEKTAAKAANKQVRR